MKQISNDHLTVLLSLLYQIFNIDNHIKVNIDVNINDQLCYCNFELIRNRIKRLQ